MAFIKCPKCGQTALSVATVCPKCGYILLQSPTPQGDSREFVNCRRCSKIIARNAAVCEFCGYPQQFRRRLRLAAAWIVAAGAVAAGLLAVLPSIRGGGAPQAEPERAAVAAPVPRESTIEPGAVAAESQPAPQAPPPTAAPILAAVPPAADTTAAPPPVVEPQGRRVTTSTLNRWAMTWANVRSGPGSDYAVVRVLRPGERVQVADASRGWWTVYQDGVVEGYVANSVLSDRQPPPDSLPGR